MKQYLSREEQISRLEREVFDVAVIGGGINGAAVARDAALRRLNVALIDRGDFAGETSSRSSKLIHGGLRYLPQGQLRLVYQALNERERLRRLTAPHLVHPIGFLFPVYAGHLLSTVFLGAGLFVYDLMARTPAPERHHSLGVEKIAALEPALERKGLVGGALYCDCAGDDARLTLENILDAAAHGAAVANYLRMDAIERENLPIRAASVRDMLSGRRLTLRARVYVNATGPWVDDIRRLDDADAPPAVRLTKGVHLVFPARPGAPAHSLVLPDGNGRIVFVIRTPESVVLGTTDTEFRGPRETVSAAPSDVDYLLDVVGRRAPGLALRAADIAASFAGLRSLTAATAGAPSQLPREEVILRSRNGLLSVAGGKLTTHRHIADRLVRMACQTLGRPLNPSPTLVTPLPGARDLPAPREKAAALSAPARAALAARYGSRAALVESIVAEQPELGAPLAQGCPVLGAEVVHAVRSEMAMELADFIMRRTALHWRHPLCAEASARAAAPIMGKELGWDSARSATAADEVVAMLRRSRLPNSHGQEKLQE